MGITFVEKKHVYGIFSPTIQNEKEKENLYNRIWFVFLVYKQT